MADYVTIEGYLTVKQGKAYPWKAHCRWSTGRPGKLVKGEVPIRVVLHVPKSLWTKPVYEVVATVDESNAVAADVILEAAGFDVYLLSGVPDPERADEDTAREGGK